MGFKRVRTVQGHAVPEHAYHAPGIFDPEVMRGPERAPDHVDEWDYPPGATVLNGMRGVQLYNCTQCGDTVAESEFDAHQCGYSQTDDADQ